MNTDTQILNKTLTNCWEFSWTTTWRGCSGIPLFGHVACRDCKLTLAFSCKCMLHIAASSHMPMWVPDVTSLTALVTNSLSCLPAPVSLAPWIRPPWGSRQPPSFGWGDQSGQSLGTPEYSIHGPYRRHVPRSCLSLPAFCLDLPMWPLKVCCVVRLGPLSCTLLYFNFFCGLLWNYGSPSGTLCFT